ncbi:MAG: glutamate racemase [Beijerinckiaceae bacterium]|nr:glutamate racemase [Beijerinckiaceae bacterium]
MRQPKILIFDSGLGGLTVLREIVRVRPDADCVYLADDAVFPYGALGEAELVARVLSLMEQHVAGITPDLVVIACNTASTLVLPPLRARFCLPFVGTVPAIKPAAAVSRSRLVSVLATPGTVARDYTKALIADHASDCTVKLVGCPRLASLAEAALRGGGTADADILAEIAPAFVQEAERLTDTVVLACTHYPLLLEAFERLAPWPVTWIDPAPAIARRVATLLGHFPPSRQAATVTGISTKLGGPFPLPEIAWACGEGRREAAPGGEGV